MYPGYDWDEDLEGAPSAPPVSDDSEQEYSDIPAPQWVQRMYGPPPAMQLYANVPLPAPIWGNDGMLQPMQIVPMGTPIAQIPRYNLQAYTPGANPYQTPGMNLRARSPSASTFQGTNSGTSSQQNAAADLENQESPTKTPLLFTDKNNNEDSNPKYSETSRSKAMKERRIRQLRTCDKDSFGVPLPNTARPFSIFASPFSVAEVCTGLGVYLASLQATVLLAMLLSICMIYPLVDNIKSQRWAKEYNIYAGSDTTISATCPKGWDLTSWITEMTIGGHCHGAYTSRYDCASLCVWDPVQLQQPQCNNVPYPGTAPALDANTSFLYDTQLTGACARHMPCVKTKLDPMAPDGPCYCCQMQLDPAALATNPSVSAGQLWTLFIAQLIFMMWTLHLIHIQLKAVAVQGSRVVGPSDYSIWISGIKRNRTDDAPLAHWCGQYGPVVAAFNVPSVGDALRVGRKVSDLLLLKAESDVLEGSTSINPLQWVYKTFVVGRPKGLASKLEQQQLKLTIYERQESEPTGQGLATFEFPEAASTAVSQFDRPPLRALLDTVTFGVTDSTPKLHGCAVRVVRAPEPSDILWEHTNCTGTPAVLRRFWSWTLTLLFILAGAGIQYGLAGMAERLREDRMLALYAAGTGEEAAVREAKAKTRRLRELTVVSGVMVVIVNLTIMLTVRVLSWYERWTTRTSMERWVMLKLSVSQLINAFAAPVLAAYASGNKGGWYARGGLVEAAFFVQCANALLPPIVHFLGIGDNLKYYVLSPFARTQPMLDRLLAPPMFPMAEQHAAAVTTLGLAMFYMPVLPISPMIALVGLSISYCLNKWIALRRAAAPPNLGGMVTSPLNWLLRLLPLIQMILMKELYFYEYASIDPVFYTGLAFWILFTLAPIRALLGAVRRRRRPPATAGLSYHRLLGGKRLGVGEVYAPLVPKPCSRKFKEKIAATFAQLAPAAFDSIINGEEVAKFLFGNGPAADAKQNIIAAMSPHEARHKGVDEAKVPPRVSFRASIAAGLHETLSLIWRPRDVDHPEDEFLPPRNVPTQSMVAPAGKNNGIGGIGGGDNDRREQQQHSYNGSTSGSCDPESGGEPTAPPPPYNGGGRGGGVGESANPNRCSSNRTDSSFIPAVRAPHQQDVPRQPLPHQRQVSRLVGGNGIGAAPSSTRRGGGNNNANNNNNNNRGGPALDMDVFRPLGSGLPF